MGAVRPSRIGSCTAIRPTNRGPVIRSREQHNCSRWKKTLTRCNLVPRSFAHMFGIWWSLRELNMASKPLVDCQILNSSLGANLKSTQCETSVTGALIYEVLPAAITEVALRQHSAFSQVKTLKLQYCWDIEALVGLSLFDNATKHGVISVWLHVSKAGT